MLFVQSPIEDSCGLIVDLGDTDAIAQTMVQVVNQPKESAKIAQKAKAKMREYDVKQIIQEYSSIYGQATAELKPELALKTNFNRR